MEIDALRQWNLFMQSIQILERANYWQIGRTSQQDYDHMMADVANELPIAVQLHQKFMLWLLTK